VELLQSSPARAHQLKVCDSSICYVIIYSINMLSLKPEVSDVLAHTPFVLGRYLSLLGKVEVVSALLYSSLESFEQLAPVLIFTLAEFKPNSSAAGFCSLDRDTLINIHEPLVQSFQCSSP
jgi:hypothetical protein